MLVVLSFVLQAQVAQLEIPMERGGSGTTWIPDAVLLPSRHTMAGSWALMAHGFLFLQYDAQQGPRGAVQFGSLNWAMLMASRQVAGGRFQARTMLSLDPATVSGRGYPLLLQTGESYRRQPLHDRQHPHDFLMELGVLYERAMSRSVGFDLYVAPSGEPALGPVAFMHRPSAMDNPVAPLSHHWQDATHISFGVLTAGVFARGWKIEGSAFNGREPDEERWGFDPIRLDSYSGRLTVNPTENLSVTAGYGFLKSPDALRPSESVHRATSSVLYGRTLAMGGQWATALVWGANWRGGSATHSFLLETEAILDRHNTLFARVEAVQKTAEDLTLSSGVFNIGSLSAGYIREFAGSRWNTVAVGFQASLNLIPRSLETVYGTPAPVGGMVFVRFRPVHRAHSMSGMKMT
jgi:hypothetical protein